MHQPVADADVLDKLDLDFTPQLPCESDYHEKYGWPPAAATWFARANVHRQHFVPTPLCDQCKRELLKAKTFICPVCQVRIPAGPQSYTLTPIR